MKTLATIRAWGTVALLFLLPWQARWIMRPASDEWTTLSLFATEAQVGLLVALALADRVFLARVRARAPRPLLVATALLVLWASATLLWAWSPDLSLQRLTMLIVAVAACGLFLGHERPRLLTDAFLATMTLQAALGVAQAAIGWSPASTALGVAFHSASEGMASVVENGGMRLLRAYGTLPHPNVLGGFLALASLLALDGIVSSVGRRRAVMAGASAVVAFGLFLTFSRSAWIAAAIGGVAYLVSRLAHRAVRPSLLPYLLLPLLPALLGVLLLSPLVVGRVTGEGRLETRSVAERYTLMERAVLFVAEHPAAAAVGVGMGYGTEPVHLVPFEVWVELGLVGLALFLLVAYRMARIAFRAGALPIALFLALSTMSLFDHYLWTLWAGNLLAAFAVFLTLDRAVSKGQDTPA